MSIEQPNNERQKELNVDQVPKQWKPRWLEMKREELKKEEDLRDKLDPNDPYRKEVTEVRIKEMKEDIAKLEADLESYN